MCIRKRFFQVSVSSYKWRESEFYNRQEVFSRETNHSYLREFSEMSTRDSSHSFFIYWTLDVARDFLPWLSDVMWVSNEALCVMCRQDPVQLKKSTSKHILMYGLNARANRFHSDQKKIRTKSEGHLDIPHVGVSFNFVLFINQAFRW